MSWLSTLISGDPTPPDNTQANISQITAFLDSAQRNAFKLNNDFADKGIAALNEAKTAALPLFQDYVDVGKAAAQSFSTTQPFKFDASTLDSDPTLKWMLKTSADSMNSSLAAQHMLGSSAGVVAQQNNQQGVRAGYAQQAYQNALSTWGANLKKDIAGMGIGEQAVAQQSGIISNTGANIANIRAGQAAGQMALAGQIGQTGAGAINQQTLQQSDILSKYELQRMKDSQTQQGVLLGAASEFVPSSDKLIKAGSQAVEAIGL